MNIGQIILCALVFIVVYIIVYILGMIGMNYLISIWGFWIGWCVSLLISILFIWGMIRLACLDN